MGRPPRRGRDAERRAVDGQAEGRDRDPRLRGDADEPDRARCAEGRWPRLPPADHGLARHFALSSGGRAHRCRMLVEERPGGRHRRGAAPRPGDGPRHRPVRRSARFRRGGARPPGTFTPRRSGNRSAVQEAGRRAVRIGCSGWNYASWKQEFYGGRPARLWLEHYAEHFDTVEVNNTFYRLPNREAVANWERTAPEGFLFTIKASRYLTHIKRLRELGEGLARFYERIEPLRTSPKMGPILWQLPPTFKRDDERLAAALARLDRTEERHCFEFRHPSWFADDVYALLREHRVALVVGDRPEVHAFQAQEFTADWTVVRFHYGSRGRRGNYSETELREWADRLRAWSEQVEVLAYFNNDWEVFAIRNARRLIDLLGA